MVSRGLRESGMTLREIARTAPGQRGHICGKSDHVEIWNSGARGTPLRGAAIGAGRQARDHLARADEHGTAGRCGRPVRTDSRTDPRRGRSEGSAQRHHPGSRPGAAERAAAKSSTSRPSHWPGPSISRRHRACSSIRWSIAGTGRRRRTPRETSRSSAAGKATSSRPRPTRAIAVPVARKKDGSPVTGRVIARLFDLPDGAHSAPIRLASLGTAQPYLPADLAQPDATLTWHSSENYAGQQDARHTVPRAAWAFANCDNSPWPGTPDPSRICVKDAFRADRLYELVYTAKDPLVLGVGLAATRDIVSFFRHAQGGCLRHAESGGRRRRAHDQHRRLAVRQFHPHVHPSRASTRTRRTASSGTARFRESRRVRRRSTCASRCRAAPPACTSRAATASSGGRDYADKARGLKAAGLLDRCTATKTCPKIIEAFGSTEFWGLRMSPDLIGTDATRDLPLPANVRRYYYPSTTHGGGRGGFPIDAHDGREQPVHAAGQSEPGSRADPRADARAGRMGDEGHAASAEPLPDAGQRRPGDADARPHLACLISPGCRSAIAY